MKLGIIDVGGGMRGVYSAGILDYCLCNNITFNYHIGVSAGAANFASFLAGQKERNYKFYHDYSFRKEYMGMERLAKTGSFLDLQYIYGTLSNTGGEDPLDFKKMMDNTSEFKVVATNALTGKPEYFNKNNFKQDSYRELMASSCIPGLNKPIYINGIPYFDGGLSDPVPLEKAILDGCTSYILILSRPIKEEKESKKDIELARIIRKKYPKSADALYRRSWAYNKAVKTAVIHQKEGISLILAPENINGINTLKRNKKAIEALYSEGVKDGEKITAWLNEMGKFLF